MTSTSLGSNLSSPSPPNITTAFWHLGGPEICLEKLHNGCLNVWYPDRAISTSAWGIYVQRMEIPTWKNGWKVWVLIAAAAPWEQLTKEWCVFSVLTPPGVWHTTFFVMAELLARFLLCHIQKLPHKLTGLERRIVFKWTAVRTMTGHSWEQTFGTCWWLPFLQAKSSSNLVRGYCNFSGLKKERVFLIPLDPASEATILWVILPIDKGFLNSITYWYDY